MIQRSFRQACPLKHSHRELSQIKASEAKFCFLYPEFGAESSKANMESTQSATSGKRIVIVVDDDHAVRDSITFSLEIEGFDVRGYSSPDDLLTNGELTGAGCLITNYNMPTMNGLELMTILRERGFVAPALLVTGHCTEIMRKRAADIGLQVIEKPFLGNRLIEKIRQALDGVS